VLGEVVGQETTGFGCDNIRGDADTGKRGNDGGDNGNRVTDVIGDDGFAGGALEEVAAFSVYDTTTTGAGFGGNGVRDNWEA